MLEKSKYRIILALQLVVLLLVLGTIGYRVLGGPQWSYMDAFYMTVITVATVGYGETHDMSGSDELRIFTVVMIFLGFGTMTYAFSTLTMAIVEGEVNQILKRRRMSKGINDLKNHVIVCGAGRTGIHVIQELRKTERPFLVIERNAERIEKQLLHMDFYHVIDDATDDEVLIRAGVQRASGLVACLPDDRDNIFITISARHLNPKLRIVSKADLETRHKLTLAGADAVVAPHMIGGLRLASEMIRPDVVNFIDRMMRSPHGTVRIDEVTLHPGCALVNQSLAQSRIRERTGALVLAIREDKHEHFHYNPPADFILTVGSVMVVLGEVQQMVNLRRLAGVDVDDGRLREPMRGEAPGDTRPVI